MNILFLTQILPYPPDAGPKVKTWHVLRYLAGQGNRIYLASFIRPEETPYLEHVGEMCQEVHTIPIKRSRISDFWYLLRSQVSKRPFLIERDDFTAMHSLVQRIIKSHRIHAVHADQLTMALYGLPLAVSVAKSTKRENGNRRDPALIFDAHNAVWTIIERIRQTSPWFMKPILSLEAKRVKEYEGRIVRGFDATLGVTNQDREALIDAANTFKAGIPFDPTRISVIPIAVDTATLNPIQLDPVSRKIITLGTLHYPPNADGIRWFAREVFPLIIQHIPNATLTIIGKNPPKDFFQLAQESSGEITVTGYVPDLDPYLKKAALVVVPVRAGGGMRVRILEAFARGLPVVTTTVGLEGIDAQPGRDVLVTDTEEDFARAVIHLLHHPVEREQLGANGRELAEAKYDWKVVMGDLGQVYDQLIGPNEK